jgi:hypothetical protein
LLSQSCVCKPGSFEDGENCSPCSSNCSTCSSASECLTCVDSARQPPKCDCI